MTVRTVAIMAALCLMVALTVSSGAQSETPATADYYVATDGDDGNAGTLEQPFATLEKAHSLAEPGDLIYVRGGTYRIGGERSAGVRMGGRNGEPGKLIRLWAYPGERPVFDFAGLTNTRAVSGWIFTGDWWHIKGFTVMNVPQTTDEAASTGFRAADCHNCIFELIDCHHNGGPGFRLYGTSSNNLVLNCDAHHNFDYRLAGYIGGDADGFGVDFCTGEGNVLRGCRSWWNSDDGYDMWRMEKGVTLDQCWAFWNGFKPDSFDRAADGNGFKLGLNTAAPRHVVQRCLAFHNRVNGFDENGSSGPEFIINNTAYNNGGAAFEFGLPFAYRLRNNVAVGGPANLGPMVYSSHNSWDLRLTVTAADFVSVDERGVDGPRGPDGSLPRPDFLAPRLGGPLIGAGLDVGLPFVGAAPDIGGKQHLQ